MQFHKKKHLRKPDDKIRRPEADPDGTGLKQNTGRGCGVVSYPRCRAPPWIERRGTVGRRRSRRHNIVVPTARVSGAHRPPRKGADDGDRLSGIGDQAREGGGGCVRERGDAWEADLRRKGWGGRIGALGRVAGEAASGHGWPAAQGIGSGGGGEGGERLGREDGLADAERYGIGVTD
jgi:hypothetical protein